MTIVILQPSYIPWRGFFELVKRADTFVFYDDVQYDKHGWRNRNRIRIPGGSDWLTIPVHSKGNVVDGLHIRNATVAWERAWNRSHLDRLTSSYKRTPHFKTYYPLIERILSPRHERLVDYTIPLTTALAGALGIATTQFVLSSELAITDDDPTRRLARIVQHLGGTNYLSGPSAKDYLTENVFAEFGITLEYIAYDYPKYEQIDGPFDAAVSIVDLLFMKGPDAPALIWGS